MRLSVSQRVHLHELLLWFGERQPQAALLDNVHFSALCLKPPNCLPFACGAAGIDYRLRLGDNALFFTALTIPTPRLTATMCKGVAQFSILSASARSALSANESAFSFPQGLLSCASWSSDCVSLAKLCAALDTAWRVSLGSDWA